MHSSKLYSNIVLSSTPGLSPVTILKLLQSSLYMSCPSQSSTFNHPDYIVDETKVFGLNNNMNFLL